MIRQVNQGMALGHVRVSNSQYVNVPDTSHPSREAALRSPGPSHRSQPIHGCGIMSRVRAPEAGPPRMPPGALPGSPSVPTALSSV
jgi:hypothetical protein